MSTFRLQKQRATAFVQLPQPFCCTAAEAGTVIDQMSAIKSINMSSCHVRAWYGNVSCVLFGIESLIERLHDWSAAVSFLGALASNLFAQINWVSEELGLRLLHTGYCSCQVKILSSIYQQKVDVLHHRFAQSAMKRYNIRQTSRRNSEQLFVSNCTAWKCCLMLYARCKKCAKNNAQPVAPFNRLDSADLSHNSVQFSVKSKSHQNVRSSTTQQTRNNLANIFLWLFIMFVSLFYTVE